MLNKGFQRYLQIIHFPQLLPPRHQSVTVLDPKASPGALHFGGIGDAVGVVIVAQLQCRFVSIEVTFGGFDHNDVAHI